MGSIHVLIDLVNIELHLPKLPLCYFFWMYNFIPYFCKFNQSAFYPADAYKIVLKDIFPVVYLLFIVFEQDYGEVM